MKNVIPTEPAKSAVTKSDIPNNAVRLIDRMFVRLKSIFPAWKHAFDSEIEYNETKQVWLEELFKANVVNPNALKRGLDAAAKSESPFWSDNLSCGAMYMIITNSACRLLKNWNRA